MNTTIEVSLPGAPPSSYQIQIGSDLLENTSSWIPKNTSTVVIITDNTVKKYYASLLMRSLQKNGYQPLLLSFRGGERSKHIRTKSRLEETMLENRCDRNSLILALGGGVVGDLAGFVAATYMRGIAYLQIPTTLLAMLDSSVGGKTGIDTPQGKNLIGAFWQPIAVITDIQCLKTLPRKHRINGLIEAFKMFLTNDAAGIRYLQHHLDSILKGDETTLIHVIQRAVTIKARIVQNDPKEHHERAVLNFGHTIGHALEQLTHYKMLHGYAVALGLLVEAKMAQLMGVLKPDAFLVIKTLLNRLDITTNDLIRFDIEDILNRCQLDKKKRDGVLYYVLLHDLGSVKRTGDQFVHAVPDYIVKDAFFELTKT